MEPTSRTRPQGHLSSLARRFSLVCLAATTLLVSTGCQSIAGSGNVAQLRIVDASPDVTAIDMYQGTGVLAYNLALGTITSYVPIAPGTYPINATAAGTHQQLVTQSGTFLAGGDYTVIVGSFAAGLQEIILKDQSVPSPAGQVALRFVDQSTRAGAVDLYLVPAGATILTVKPVLTGVTLSTNSGYLLAPSAAYTLVALPAGTVPSAAAAVFYTSPTLNFGAGAARTIILIDPPIVTAPGLEAVIADDYDPIAIGN